MKKAVFAHLTGQKLGVTYSKTTTRLYTAFQVQDRNLGQFYLFITAAGVPAHRFSLKSGPYQVRYPARRRIIVTSNVYKGVFGPACELVEVYGTNVAFDYTADAPGRKCPVGHPPSAFRTIDHVLRALPGA